MTGCAMCGRCCDPVVLRFDVYQGVMESARSEDGLHPNIAFIAEHWRVLGAWRDGYGALQLDLSCDAFDPLSRRCTAHERRPPVCERYPWYGDDPATCGRAPTLYRECSYLMDVPPAERGEEARPLIPITPVNGGRDA